jgi:hypothetical protein
MFQGFMVKRSLTLPSDTPGRIRTVGTHLFGSEWRKRMAAGLGISRSTLYLWLAGANTSRDIDGDLIALLDAERDGCAERGMQITALRRQLIEGGTSARAD